MVNATGHPKFDHPPIAEVTLSVQFESLPGLHAAHIGRLWDRWSGRYPQHEEHGELAPMPDENDEGLRQPSIMLKFIEAAPLPRTWFLDASGEHIVQVQRDRFVLNWRRKDDTYPHYAELLPRFQQEYDVFASFVAEHNLGDLVPDQCQVTYLNPVPLEGEYSCPGGMAGLLEGWSGTHSESPTLDGGEASVQIRYPITDQGGSRRGRLIVTVGSAVRAETDEAVLLLEMTARGRPLSGSLEGIVEFLDHGHDAIVTMFAALTTTQMHTVWGRQS